MLKILLLIWLIGGTVLYLQTLPSEDADGIDRACDAHNIPHIFGQLTSYVITVTIGFPFFIYKVIKNTIGGVDYDSQDDNWRD